jgi:hypothetical protein
MPISYLQLQLPNLVQGTRRMLPQEAGCAFPVSSMMLSLVHADIDFPSPPSWLSGKCCCFLFSLRCSLSRSHSVFSLPQFRPQSAWVLQHLAVVEILARPRGVVPALAWCAYLPWKEAHRPSYVASMSYYSVSHNHTRSTIFPAWVGHVALLRWYTLVVRQLPELRHILHRAGTCLESWFSVANLLYSLGLSLAIASWWEQKFRQGLWRYSHQHIGWRCWPA